MPKTEVLPENDFSGIYIETLFLKGGVAMEDNDFSKKIRSARLRNIVVAVGLGFLAFLDKDIFNGIVRKIRTDKSGLGFSTDDKEKED